MSKPTNEWYCKDLRNTVINRQKREINKLNKENEKMKNKIKEIKDKLISFEFETTNYKDLDFISKIIQDLKLIIKEN